MRSRKDEDKPRKKSAAGAEDTDIVESADEEVELFAAETEEFDFELEDEEPEEEFQLE
jgi:hypothetical protein